MPDRDELLAATEWLAANLDNPDLRVLECTVFLRRRDDGKPGFRIVPGREEWAAGHIPGSGFADLHHDLSDRDQELRFMAPSPEQFAEAMGRYGVGDDSQVVLYDRAGSMWAARVWWMLRAYGFGSSGAGSARVLDGGWNRWLAEGRPVSSDPPSVEPATFTPRPRAELFASKDDVLAAMESGACIVNALSAEQHRGEVAPYGRPGHITGSVNVPAMGPTGVIDPETQLYHDAARIRELFEASGAHPERRMVTYCGGGIAASSTAFAAILAGYDDVAVYDASLSEWAADPSLPMEAGE